MYQIVAIDLDETLFNDQHEICERNKIAIQKARELGVKIVPCSGRGPGFLGNLLDELDLQKENEYSILCNGAVIVDNKENQIIACNPLPFNKTKELFKFGYEHNVCVQIFTPEAVYFYFADEQEKAMGRKFGNNIIFREDYDISEFENKVVMKLLFEKIDMPYLHSLEEFLKPLTEGAVAVSYSSNRYLELNAIGINKGVGLKLLADHLQVDMKDTIGIGDNYNDMQLVEDAGLGIAVANAKDVIKNLADVICEADNNEGGVGEAIERFILNVNT